MKIDIKARYTDQVLFSHEAENNTLRLTLEAAVKARADLARANLPGANLAGANLAGADLTRAYLPGAHLPGANLAGANLAGAHLPGAYLAGAYLAGAKLTGAKLTGAYLTDATLRDGEVLTGERPVIQIGPIGSRGDYLVAYMTNQGLRFDAGCQRQITRDQLEARIDITHGTNKYAQEYHAAIAFAEAHYEIWKN